MWITGKSGCLPHLPLQGGQVTKFTCQMCHELPLTGILPSPGTQRAPGQQPLTSQESRTPSSGGGWFSPGAVVPGFLSSFRPEPLHAGKAPHVLFLNHYSLQLHQELRYQHSKKAKGSSTRDLLPLLPELVLTQGIMQSLKFKKVLCFSKGYF